MPEWHKVDDMVIIGTRHSAAVEEIVQRTFSFWQTGDQVRHAEPSSHAYKLYVSHLDVVELEDSSSMTAHLSDSRVLRGSEPLKTAPCPPPSVTTLPELFRYRAKAQPEVIAFSCSNDEDELKTVTYTEADATVTSLAAQIAQLFPVSDANSDERAVVIAVWLEKGIDLILSILATTYSGATWLPFDQDVPD